MTTPADPWSAPRDRPRGHRGAAGSSFFYAEISAKRLELLKTLIPRLARAGVLVNPDNPAMASVVHEMQGRAQTLGVKLHQVSVRRLDEMDGVVERARTQVEALVVVEEGLFVGNARRTAELATRYHLPSIGFREYCEASGLLAYGVDLPHIWRQAGASVDKILRGAKPADLPIQQPTRFEMVVNLKAAKALGLTIPPLLLARADRVLQCRWPPSGRRRPVRSGWWRAG